MPITPATNFTVVLIKFKRLLFLILTTLLFINRLWRRIIWIHLLPSVALILIVLLIGSVSSFVWILDIRSIVSYFNFFCHDFKNEK